MFADHGADFSNGFFHASSMRSCTGLYLHGDVIFTAEAGKTRRVYHVQHDLCQAFHNHAAFVPCHTYVGRMKVRSGTTLPQVLDNLMLWLQKQLITQNAISIRQAVFKSKSICAETNAYETTFCSTQMSCQQKNQGCLMDLAIWQYLCCDHERSDTQMELFSK